MTKINFTIEKKLFNSSFNAEQIESIIRHLFPYNKGGLPAGSIDFPPILNELEYTIRDNKITFNVTNINADDAAVAISKIDYFVSTIAKKMVELYNLKENLELIK